MYDHTRWASVDYILMVETFAAHFGDRLSVRHWQTVGEMKSEQQATYDVLTSS